MRQIAVYTLVEAGRSPPTRPMCIRTNATRLIAVPRIFWNAANSSDRTAARGRKPLLSLQFPLMRISGDNIKKTLLLLEWLVGKIRDDMSLDQCALLPAEPTRSDFGVPRHVGLVTRVRYARNGKPCPKGARLRFARKMPSYATARSATYRPVFTSSSLSQIPAWEYLRNFWLRFLTRISPPSRMEAVWAWRRCIPLSESTEVP